MEYRDKDTNDIGVLRSKILNKYITDLGRVAKIRYITDLGRGAKIS